MCPLSRVPPFRFAAGRRRAQASVTEPVPGSDSDSSSDEASPTSKSPSAPTNSPPPSTTVPASTNAANSAATVDASTQPTESLPSGKAPSVTTEEPSTSEPDTTVAASTSGGGSDENGAAAKKGKPPGHKPRLKAKSITNFFNKLFKPKSKDKNMDNEKQAKADGASEKDSRGVNASEAGAGESKPVTFKVNDRVLALFKNGPLWYVVGLARLLQVCYRGCACAVHGQTVFDRSTTTTHLRFAIRVTRYPGKVKKVVKKGKLYDLKYDDGDKEQKVPAELIRPKVQYAMGDAVLAQPRKQTAWKRASIASIGDDIDAACSVQYTDGSNESLLPSRIKPRTADDVTEDPSLNHTMASTIGGATDASSVSSSDEESPGKPAKPGSTPKQRSDSAPRRKAIERAVDASAASEDDASTDKNSRQRRTAVDQQQTQSPPGTKFALGDSVLALFEKGTKWYTGKIKGVIDGDGAQGTATYDVAYDDGDTEEGVAENLIRAVVKYMVGDVIEAQYDAGTVWYKGKVVGVSETYDDSYSVLYDDGDREDDLEHVLMRPYRPADDPIISADKSNTDVANPPALMAGEQAIGEEDNWATPKSLRPAVLEEVRKALSAILGDMDKKGEQLSIRTARTRLEEQFGNDLNSGTWKAWVKSTSEAIMEKWDEEEDGGSSSSSGKEGASSKAKQTPGSAKTEFDTPDTTSKDALDRVRKVTEEIMEIMDEKDEKMKASTIQHRVSDKLGERKVDSPHWTKWFKTECQAILDRWDEEESESGSDSASEGADSGAFPSTAAFPKMSKAEFGKVRKSVGSILNSMNDKQEPLSLKVMRQRVEQQLNTKFEGSQWKGWFKDEAQVVIDSWPDSDQEQDEAGRDTPAASPKKPKYVSLSSMGDAELDKIEEAAERILEEIDELETVTIERVASVAATVCERVEQEMSLDLGDREWRNWFKTLCKDIVEEWDADDDDED